MREPTTRALDADLALRLSAEAFQSREIALLQAGRYDEWLTLLTEDMRYWVPVVPEGAREPDAQGRVGELAWIDDDLAALTVRVRRLQSGLAVEEAAPARTRYFVQNLLVAPANADGSEVQVVSNFLLHLARRDRQEAYFCGGRDDLLRRVAGDWKLARRKVVLDHNVLAPGNRFSAFF